MNMDNFVAFSIVCGFFVGLVISVIKFSTAEMITIFTLVVTVVFYLITLLSASFFIKYFDFKKVTIHKNKYDEMLDHFIEEFDKREKSSDKIREFIRSLEHSISEEELDQIAKNKARSAT